MIRSIHCTPPLFYTSSRCNRVANLSLLRAPLPRQTFFPVGTDANYEWYIGIAASSRRNTGKEERIADRGGASLSAFQKIICRFFFVAPSTLCSSSDGCNPNGRGTRYGVVDDCEEKVFFGVSHVVVSCA